MSPKREEAAAGWQREESEEKTLQAEPRTTTKMQWKRKMKRKGGRRGGERRSGSLSRCLAAWACAGRGPSRQTMCVRSCDGSGCLLRMKRRRLPSSLSTPPAQATPRSPTSPEPCRGRRSMPTPPSPEQSSTAHATRPSPRSSPPASRDPPPRPARSRCPPCTPPGQSRSGRCRRWRAEGVIAGRSTRRRKMRPGCLSVSRTPLKSANETAATGGNALKLALPTLHRLHPVISVAHLREFKIPDPTTGPQSIRQPEPMLADKDGEYSLRLNALSRRRQCGPAGTMSRTMLVNGEGDDMWFSHTFLSHEAGGPASELYPHQPSPTVLPVTAVQRQS
mmetsp:Transcript_25360/g.51655  ORF Transcript_25360/g.51655 Transcript_25360/m.51655 type:complete len:335 (-) Transcript_25360:212-1216(-)